MVKAISKRGALKAFYYLLLVDGVSAVEIERFRDIGAEITGESQSNLIEDVIEDCEEELRNILDETERYDIILEEIDASLKDEAEELKDGVVQRLLMWDMITLAYCDNNISGEENRLISHIARTMQIDRDIVNEMKHLIAVAHSIQEEKEALQNSDKKYAEIRPLMDEIDKREMVIMEAAKALISDDLYEEEEVTETKSASESVKETGKKIVDSVASGGKKLGETVAPLAKSAGGAALKGAESLKQGAGKLFSKLKDSSKK